MVKEANGSNISSPSPRTVNAEEPKRKRNKV